MTLSKSKDLIQEQRVWETGDRRSQFHNQHSALDMKLLPECMQLVLILLSFSRLPAVVQWLHEHYKESYRWNGDLPRHFVFGQ